MSEYSFKPANKESFAVYHTIYTDANIFMHFDWKERIENILSIVNDDAFYIYQSDKLIGGITLTNNRINYPFLVPPFHDRAAFWKSILSYAEKNCSKDEIEFTEMPQSDAEVLTSLGAEIRWSKRRMCRPTTAYDIKTYDDFILVQPNEDDLADIVSVVYLAHSAGYTATVWGKPDIAVTHEEIIRRFNLFSQTNSWNMSVVAKQKDTNKIVGVCIAGIYPDSPNFFSTIHQVSVLPQYRGKSIATAMMHQCMSAAHSVSPVITLGVLIGNPAEELYQKLGFLPGPSYSNMIYNPHVNATIEGGSSDE